jgi:hypothetical protein
MGRNNSDFEKHIRVFRGITGSSARTLLGSEKGLGIHWSNSEAVADAFADPSSSIRGHKTGVMLSGLVHPDDVMTPKEIKAHNKGRLSKAILPSDSSEKEVPVRPGSTIHVTGTTSYTKTGDVKEKTYKTPKKAKA